MVQDIHYQPWFYQKLEGLPLKMKNLAGCYLASAPEVTSCFILLWSSCQICNKKCWQGAKASYWATGMCEWQEIGQNYIHVFLLLELPGYIELSYFLLQNRGRKFQVHQVPSNTVDVQVVWALIFICQKITNMAQHPCGTEKPGSWWWGLGHGPYLLYVPWMQVRLTQFSNWKIFFFVCCRLPPVVFFSENDSSLTFPNMSNL